jgi:hypothetical protein
VSKKTTQLAKLLHVQKPNIEKEIFSSVLLLTVCKMGFADRLSSKNTADQGGPGQPYFFI